MKKLFYFSLQLVAFSLFWALGLEPTAFAGTAIVPVVDMFGDPATNTECILTDFSIPQSQNSAVAIQWRAVLWTDSTGRLTLPNLAPGKIQVRPVGENLATFTFNMPATNGTISAQYWLTSDVGNTLPPDTMSYGVNASDLRYWKLWDILPGGSLSNVNAQTLTGSGNGSFPIVTAPVSVTYGPLVWEVGPNDSVPDWEFKCLSNGIVVANYMLSPQGQFLNFNGSFYDSAGIVLGSIPGVNIFSLPTIMDNPNNQITGTFTTADGQVLTSYVDEANLDNFAWQTYQASRINDFLNVGKGSWTNTISKIKQGKTFTVEIDGSGLMGLMWADIVTNLANNFTFAGAGPFYELFGSMGTLYNYPTAYSSTVWRHFQDGYWYNQVTSFDMTNLGGPTATLTFSCNYPFNAIEIDYVTAAWGSTFTLYTNNGSGTWVTTGQSASTVSANVGGGSLFWTNAPGFIGGAGYQLQQSAAGTNRIVNNWAKNTTISNGFMFNTMTASSSGTTYELAVSNAIQSAIYANWKPDLILWQSIENSNQLATNLPLWLTFYKTNNPNADVVLSGTYPANATDPSGTTWEQGLAVRNIAMQQYPNVGYFDSYSPFESTNLIVSRGWWTDGIHHNGGTSAYGPWGYFWYRWLDLASYYYRNDSNPGSVRQSMEQAGADMSFYLPLPQVQALSYLSGYAMLNTRIAHYFLNDLTPFTGNLGRTNLTFMVGIFATNVTTQIPVTLTLWVETNSLSGGFYTPTISTNFIGAGTNTTWGSYTFGVPYPILSNASWIGLNITDSSATTNFWMVGVTVHN